MRVALGQADTMQEELQDARETIERLKEELAFAAAHLSECEDRFRCVLDQSIDVTYRRNLKTDCYDYLSPSIEKITGYTAEEFSRIRSADLLDYIHPDDHQVVKRRFELFEQSRFGAPIQNLFEYRLKRKDGGYRWISDSGVLITGADGTPLYHVGVARDITERKRFEDELQQSNERLETAVIERTARLQRLAEELTLAEQRERRRLSDFLHDDLQQVLVAAKYKSEALAACQPTEPPQQEARELQALVTEALSKTRSICNDLVTPLLYDVGFEAALRQLADQMWERHRLRVELDFQEMPDLPEEAVRVQLFNSLRELLFNVAKHAGANSATLQIRRRDGQLELTVADAGRGFDPESVRSDEYLACGYGLFSISERMKAVGGQLSIKSAPGRGATITMALPVSAKLKAEARTPAREAAETGRPSQDSGRARVIVADDHDLVRHGIVQLLSEDPALEVVGEATNGHVALDLARQLRPDVIVMDIRMPGMDGIEATRLIKAEFSDTVIIGISAFKKEGFRTAMLDAGAVDLIDKVDVTSELIPTIARWLAERGKRQA